MMDCWLCVLLLVLHCTTITVSQTCSEEGAVVIIGTVTDTLIAGRLEICAGGRWHSVYDDGWTLVDVRLICGERGFPLTGASFCNSSCFGASNQSSGYKNFVCIGATRFSDCQRELVNKSFPGQNAGIVCKREVTDHPDSTLCPDCMSCPTPPPCYITTLQDTDAWSDGTDSKMTTKRENYTAIGASLGVVCTLLLLSLVGVVTGWVWSCCRNKGMKQRDDTDMLQLNPCYVQSTTLGVGQEVEYQEIEWKTDRCAATGMQQNLCYGQTMSSTLCKEEYEEV